MIKVMNLQKESVAYTMNIVAVNKITSALNCHSSQVVVVSRISTLHKI
jgi:hypothetical protein